jgi:TetR/AcrR family transcriptional regulator, cholesterol catabolism regulator
MARNRDMPLEMRQKVLDTAARLFRDKGYAATTMREVAERCGIRAASLYYHFPSKDEILAEVFDYGVRHVSDAVRGAVERLPRAASSYDKVRAAIVAHLESFFVYGDYTATNIRVFGQAPRGVQRRNRKLRDRYERYWQRLLEEARRRGELRRGLDLTTARLFLIGGLNHTLEWYTKGRGASFEELADRYAKLFFHGIGGRNGLSSR